ncbi:MAG TPA: aspartate aminotransferase family protein [Steroidobacteraceae bacterium]|nr:aspartate aminotransferase family protein [Steroidobacteraceae bacterium]
MSRVLHRAGAPQLPIAVRGDGCYVIDKEGKRYLDGSGGAVVSCLGHSHPRIREAIHQQVDRLAYTHASMFSTEPMEELASLLVGEASGELAKAYFVSGGSEATEAALMISRHFWAVQGGAHKRWFISRKSSYHGFTTGSLGVSGAPYRRQHYECILPPANLISRCFPYRDRPEGESLEMYGQRMADELETKIIDLGPENVVAFIAETVVGASLGAVAAPPGYFKRIRSICDRHDVLLILDEVLCGCGRTGTSYAFQQEQVRPDLVTIGKGLAAGYQPIGAVLIGHRVAQALAAGASALRHGFTYSGHATACAAALAVQQTLREEDLLPAVRRKGALLENILRQRLGARPHVGDIRGRGLLWGVELVQDRDSKEPFAPVYRLHERVQKAALRRGLLCYPMQGALDGYRGDHIQIAPPYIVSEEQIEDLARILEESIIDAVGQVHPGGRE